MKNKIDVNYVAQLARLSLTEEEIALFSTQLDQIIKFVEKIQQLDLKNVEPLAHPLPLVNIMRPDSLHLPLPREQALANAPEKTTEYFLVPKVLE